MWPITGHSCSRWSHSLESQIVVLSSIMRPWQDFYSSSLKPPNYVPNFSSNHHPEHQSGDSDRLWPTHIVYSFIYIQKRATTVVFLFVCFFCLFVAATWEDNEAKRLLSGTHPSSQCHRHLLRFKPPSSPGVFHPPPSPLSCSVSTINPLQSVGLHLLEVTNVHTHTHTHITSQSE